jgi:hypothetical protein
MAYSRQSLEAAQALLALAQRSGVQGGGPLLTGLSNGGFSGVNRTGNARNGQRYRSVLTDGGNEIHVYEDGTRVFVRKQPAPAAHTDRPGEFSVALDALTRPRRRRSRGGVGGAVFEL